VSAVSYRAISTPTRDEDAQREMAAMLISYAATGCTMVAAQPTEVTSPIYVDVCLDLYRLSHVQKWAHPFSSCAYLPHWMLESLGLGSAPGIGRRHAENPLTRLAFNRYSEELHSGDPVETGDVVWTGSNGDSHVQVVLAGNSDHTVLVAEYGQEGIVDAVGRKLGGHIALKQITRAGLQFWGKKPARRILRLSRLLEEVTPADAHIPEPLWEWIPEALRARFDPSLGALPCDTIE
jgi:hypothetical protein